MVTTTTTYSLKKPTVGQDEDLWGGYLNDSMDLIDDVLDGTTPVTGIDINSGTIDNAVIGGTTPVAGTFTALTANTSLGVTGNITVSGTVDGRDVAADGTKLDGIESGATADQTKADIDALGIAASTAATLATARNIALTGAVTGNVNFDGSGNVSIATTATADPTLTLSGDASGSATFTNLGNATLTVTVADDSHNHVISNVDGLQTALDGKLSTSGTAANSQLLDSLDSTQFLRSDAEDTGNILNLNGGTGNGSNDGTLYVTAGNNNDWGIRIGATSGKTEYGQIIEMPSSFNYAFRVLKGGSEHFNINSTGATISGNYIWHAGNDGSGSGLDADTVDGVHESTFMRKSANSSLSFNGYNINSVEDIYLRDKLFHDGDTDTYLGFGNNYVEIYAGNSQSLYVDANGAYVTDGSLREDYDALSGTSPTCNVNSGGAFSLSMSGNTTFTFTSPSTGYSTGFVLQLTGNGSTVTWPSSVDWAGGTAPDAPASGETDIYVFWTRDGGTTWYGVQSIDAAA